MADGAGARRLAFLDACRALAVLGMLFANMMNVFLRRVPEVLQHNEGDVLRAFDFPAPVFQFLIGVSLVLFLHKRTARGLAPGAARFTAVWRFALLAGLGIVLDTVGTSSFVAVATAASAALLLATAGLEGAGVGFPAWLLAVGANALTAWVLQYVLVYYPAWLVFPAWQRLPLLRGMAAVLAALAALSALTIILGRRA